MSSVKRTSACDADLGRTQRHFNRGATLFASSAIGRRNSSGLVPFVEGGEQRVERADMLAQRGQLCCHRRLIGSVLAVSCSPTQASVKPSKRRLGRAALPLRISPLSASTQALDGL